jgi:N4-gp56 family major capsid protein
MADSRVSSGLTVEQWDDKFFTEYLTENRYSGEMGTDEASIIQVKENLMKKKGDRINFALVNSLSQDAITGSNTLEGNEEDMASRSCEVAVNKRRNGVRVAEIDEQYSAIGLREAGRAVLKDWSLKDTETLISNALGKMTDGTSTIAMTTAAVGLAGNQTALDAWLSNNSDRVYFGNAAYAASSGDLSAGLATLTSSTAAERLTAVNLSAMRFLAETRASPKIRPVRVDAGNGRRYFVVYTNPLGMRDLKADSTITQSQREVVLEMENNRLFKGGDILWDGMIVKSIPDMFGLNTLTNLGDSATTTVVPAFLCGAQAIGAAYAKRWTSKEQAFDYGDKQGVAIESIYGIDKLTFGSGTGDRTTPKDNGIVTGFFAASAAT